LTLTPFTATTRIGNPDTGTERITGDTDLSRTQGTVAGALIGGVVGAGDCHEYLYQLCIFGYLIEGMKLGSAAGAVIGTSKPSSGQEGTSLPENKVREVEATLSRITTSRDLQNEIFETLSIQLPADITAPPDASDIKVTAWLNNINFFQHNAGDIRLELVGWLSLYTEADQFRTYAKEFRYSSNIGNIERWLEDDGALFGSVISDGLGDLANQMTEMLLQYRDNFAPAGI